MKPFCTVTFYPSQSPYGGQEEEALHRRYATLKINNEQKPSSKRQIDMGSADSGHQHETSKDETIQNSASPLASEAVEAVKVVLASLLRKILECTP